MKKIQEIVIEPNKIEVETMFKLKVRVVDDYRHRKIMISEDNKKIITEDYNEIRTEWGE